MIYGDRETRIPDINAIKQSNNLYAYCMNNPVNFVDTSGLWVETGIDIISFVFSACDVISNPSDGWAWAGLVGDALDFIPVVTGVGESIKGARLSAKVADTTKSATKITSDAVETWGKAASSKVLRENMIAVGKKVPDYKNAAHHIVAGSSNNEFAQEARKILEGFDIDINHSANGVFLPTKKGVSDAAYHPSLHTNKYYENVAERLSTAQSREEALGALNQIGQELQNGTFPK